MKIILTNMLMKIHQMGGGLSNAATVFSLMNLYNKIPKKFD